MGSHEDVSSSNAGATRPGLAQYCAELQSADELRARASARHLLEYPCEKSAIAALVVALGRPGLVARDAMRSLAEIGTPALSALIQCLRDPKAGNRWHAAMALAQIAAPESAPALVAALTDGDASVRWEAVKALAAIGGPSLAPLLTTLATQTLTAWLATSAQRVLLRLEPLFPALHLELLRRMLAQTHEHIGVPVEAYRLLHNRPLDADLRRPWEAEVRAVRPSHLLGV
jgi:HEAT repeat protein